jgi:hypothetical protein
MTLPRPIKYVTSTLPLRGNLKNGSFLRVCSMVEGHGYQCYPFAKMGGGLQVLVAGKRTAPDARISMKKAKARRGGEGVWGGLATSPALP